jgi:hypothetical protein
MIPTSYESADFHIPTDSYGNVFRGSFHAREGAGLPAWTI